MNKLPGLLFRVQLILKRLGLISILNEEMTRIKQLTEHLGSVNNSNSCKRTFDNVSDEIISGNESKCDFVTQKSNVAVNSAIVNDKLHEILNNIQKDKNNLIYKAAETINMPVQKRKKRKRKTESVKRKRNDSTSSDTDIEMILSAVLQGGSVGFDNGASENELSELTSKKCFTSTFEDDSVEESRHGSKNHKKKSMKRIIVCSSPSSDSDVSSNVDKSNKSKCNNKKELVSGVKTTVNNGYSELNDGRISTVELSKFTFNNYEKKFQHDQDNVNSQVPFITSKEPSTVSNNRNDIQTKIQSKLSKFVNKFNHSVSNNSVNVENKINTSNFISNTKSKAITSVGDQVKHIESDFIKRNSSVPLSQTFRTDSDKNNLVDSFNVRNNSDNKPINNHVGVSDVSNSNLQNELPQRSSQGLSCDRDSILMNGTPNSNCVENNGGIIISESSQESSIPSSSQNLLALSQRSQFLNVLTNSDEEDEALQIDL